MVATSEQDGEARLTTFKALVESHANSIAEDLERGQRSKRTKWPEQDALIEYARIEVGAQRSFMRATSSARLGTLVLDEFYEPTSRSPRFKQPYADLIATMLAARAEANGRAYLNDIEGTHIAAALERTGKELLSAGFPGFAEQAFDQAACIHARFRDKQSEDRCQYLRLEAHRRTYPQWHPMRFAWGVSRWLIGYGYKPMRMLVWIAVVITGFAVYLLQLPRDPGATRGDALFVTLQNFVNPVGLGSAKSMSRTWEAPLEVESYTGDVLRNVFFVLLIRRWFRL